MSYFDARKGSKPFLRDQLYPELGHDHKIFVQIARDPLKRMTSSFIFFNKIEIWLKLTEMAVLWKKGREKAPYTLGLVFKWHESGTVEFEYSIVKDTAKVF